MTADRLGAASVPPTRPGRRLTAWVVVLLALLFAGTAATSAIVFTHLAGETGAATSDPWAGNAHMLIGGTADGEVPATVPPLVSHTLGTPTVLPTANGSYMLNAGGTAGNESLNFTVNETSGQSKSTYFELRVAITVNESGHIVQGVVVSYLESQSVTTTSPYQYTFVYDLGTTGSVVYDKQVEIIEECPGNACP